MFRYFPYTLSFCCNFSCCTFSVLHSFHIAQFSCLTFFVLSSFSVAFLYVALSRYHTVFTFTLLATFVIFRVFFVLHFFRVAPFLCFVIFFLHFFVEHSFHVTLFSCCSFLGLHYSYVAFLCCTRASCCTFFVLHWFLFVKAIICVHYFAILGPNCRLIPRICPNFQKLLKQIEFVFGLVLVDFQINTYYNRGVLIILANT